MNKNTIRNILLFITAFGLLSAVPLFPVKDSFIPMAFAYPTLIWHIRDWNIESYFEGCFAHSIAIIISHLALSLALTLAILKRLTKRTAQTKEDKQTKSSTQQEQSTLPKKVENQFNESTLNNNEMNNQR